MQEYRRLQKQILELKTFVTSVSTPDKTKIFTQNFPVEDIHNEIDVCNVSNLKFYPIELFSKQLY